MREIKFRGKATLSIEQLDELGIEHENGWVYGSLISNGNFPYIAGKIVEATDEYVAHEFWAKVIPETVGQYTGLKDKHGVEVYEGDILEEWEEGRYLWIVSFCEDEAGFVVIESNRDHSYTGLDMGDVCRSSEVIGNIYEHPHLLGGKK